MIDEDDISKENTMGCGLVCAVMGLAIGTIIFASGENFGVYIIILAIISAIIISFVTISSKDVKKSYETELINFLQSNNFKLTQKVEIEPMRLEFCIDGENNKFAIVSYERDENLDTKIFRIQQYEYSDLIDFELLEDYDEHMQGRGLVATGGALLFGAAGAVIGSSGGRKISKINRSIVINLHLNNIKTPLVIINFSMLLGYEYAYKNAQTIKSFLLLIKQHKEIPKNNETANNTQDKNIVSKMKQLKELYEEGLLTEEEFNNKKKELLNSL